MKPIVGGGGGAEWRALRGGGAEAGWAEWRGGLRGGGLRGAL